MSRHPHRALGNDGVLRLWNRRRAGSGGYLRVVVKTDNGPQEIEILYPADPGSIYHMTKTQDALFFHYYNKNYGIQITDLHQGIVWGTQTKETRLAPELINRFAIAAITARS